MRFCANGWGVIFAASTSSQVKQALQSLLEHRKAEAGALYKEFRVGSRAETAYDFLIRHGVAPGVASHEKVPYYILIVGSPEEITFSFQYQLGVQYGVGRIYFDSLDGYYKYAINIVAAEKSSEAARKRLALFAPVHQADRGSQLHFEMALRLEKFVVSRFDAWAVDRIDHSNATKAALMDILASPQRLPLLFILSHGAMLNFGHPLQALNQGGILCDEFYQRNAHGHADNMTSEVMLCKTDIPNLSCANVDILFLDACNSAGTSEYDDLPLAPIDQRRRLAPSDSLAPLPLSLLSVFSDGPLAVIGHVNAPSTLSLFWNDLYRGSQTYELTLSRLLEGHPIGFAVKPHAQKYAEILAMIHPSVINARDHVIGGGELERLYRMAIGERNLIIIGDPAVRIGMNLLRC